LPGPPIMAQKASHHNGLHHHLRGGERGKGGCGEARAHVRRRPRPKTKTPVQINRFGKTNARPPPPGGGGFLVAAKQERWKGV